MKPSEIIALSSDDDNNEKEEQKITTTNNDIDDDADKINENKIENNNKINSTNNITPLVINDSDSDSLQSQSSSQHSENYEAEDENESEMKAKQQQLLQTSSHTQQQLQQVQRFLKSFDSNNIEMEKSSLTELRNFRQAPKHLGLTKHGKFNISTKFLRKSRNKLKSHNINCTQMITQSNIDVQNINNNISSNNNNDESIAKLKDFSIDSLLNH